jgi:hypothetical protein
MEMSGVEITPNLANALEPYKFHLMKLHWDHLEDLEDQDTMPPVDRTTSIFKDYGCNLYLQPNGNVAFIHSSSTFFTITIFTWQPHPHLGSCPKSLS